MSAEGESGARGEWLGERSFLSARRFEPGIEFVFLRRSCSKRRDAQQLSIDDEEE